MEVGALGSLNVTMLTYPKNFGSVTIIGEKGTARIGGIALNEVQVEFLRKASGHDLIKKIAIKLARYMVLVTHCITKMSKGSAEWD